MLAYDNTPPESQKIMEEVAKEVEVLQSLLKCGSWGHTGSRSNNKKAMKLSSKLASADTKLKTEVTNDQQDHYHHSRKQHNADSNAWRASKSATLDQEEQATAPSLVLGSTQLDLEESIEAPTPARMDEGSGKKQSDLENEAVHKVFHKHSTAGDSTAWKRDSGQDTYSQDCRSGSLQTETRFADAPWRKKQHLSMKALRRKDLLLHRHHRKSGQL